MLGMVDAERTVCEEQRAAFCIAHDLEDHAPAPGRMGEVGLDAVGRSRAVARLSGAGSQLADLGAVAFKATACVEPDLSSTWGGVAKVLGERQLVERTRNDARRRGGWAMSYPSSSAGSVCSPCSARKAPNS